MLPGHFLDVAIGALIPVPPPRIEFSMLLPSEGRVTVATLEITGRASRSIPLVRAGEHCGNNATIRKADRAVLVGTVTIGEQRQHVVVLAESPFLVLDGSVRCVRLPPPTSE